MSVSASGVYQYSFVLSGLAGVGKTIIFNYVKKELAKSNERQSEADFSSRDGGLDCCLYSTIVDGVKCNVSVYDTGGLERYNSLTANYYHRCHAVILVYLNDPDKADTLTCLNMSIESALSYNKSPEQLVFALWGNNFRDSPSSSSEDISSHQDLVSAFIENSGIPSNLHSLIHPVTGEGIKEGLDRIIRAVSSKYKAKTDSVLTPSIDSAGSYSCESTERQQAVRKDGEVVTLDKNQEEATRGKQSRGRKKCCLRK